MNKGFDFDADAMGAAIDDVEMLGDLLAQTAGEAFRKGTLQRMGIQLLGDADVLNAQKMRLLGFTGDDD